MPTQITGLNGRGITQIAAGRFHTIARAADGSARLRLSAELRAARGEQAVAAAGRAQRGS